MKNLIIREVSEKDIDSLCELTATMGLPITKQDMLYRMRLYSRYNTNHAWVAELDKKIVGCIAVQITQNFLSNDKSAYIVTMIVNKSYRQKGIATSLVHKAESFCWQQGCKTIQLAQTLQGGNTPDFFQAKGYTIDNENQSTLKYLQSFESNNQLELYH